MIGNMNFMIHLIKQALEIMDEILYLKFQIVSHPDIDDECEEGYLDLYQADSEGIFSIDKKEVIQDYIKACKVGAQDVELAAKKIISLLEMNLFKNIKIEECIEIEVNNPLYTYMLNTINMDLSNAICSTKEENLKRAEIMMATGRESFGIEAAKLYRELGEESKCINYFEKHLGKTKEAYEIVIDYYKNSNYDKAVEIARRAIENCKEDQTSFFILLIQNAKDKGDELAYKKLMQSAHRRRLVKSSELDAIFSWEN